MSIDVITARQRDTWPKQSEVLQHCRESRSQTEDAKLGCVLKLLGKSNANKKVVAILDQIREMHATP